MRCVGCLSIVCIGFVRGYFCVFRGFTRVHWGLFVTLFGDLWGIIGGS